MTEDVHFEKDMIIQDAVNLILCDGTTLKVDDGIWVQPQASLTVWAQSNGKNRGRLVAKGGDKKAGIGCLKSYVAGFTVINGGDIEARGGKEAAGITGEVVTINNGKVHAQGGWRSAGIGGSRQMDCRGDVNINGGVVEAKGGAGGSGIGGGEKGNLTATVTITGGTVNATGYNGGAGIGGGDFGGANNGHVNITGGTVTATSYEGGAGIGGGREGFYFEGGEGSNVTISGTA